MAISSPSAAVMRRFAAPGLGALVAIGLAAGTAAAASGSTGEHRMLTNYASSVPFDLHAPTWVPDGYRLFDGDGPWTTFPGDIHRAEIMYSEPGWVGAPPLMIAQMDHTSLPESTLALPAVAMADGIGHHFVGEVWSAFYWEVGDLTMAIEFRELSINEIVRVADSMRPVLSSD